MRPAKGETMNPNGRRKRQYTQHLNELREKGYNPPTRDEYHEMVGMLLSMTEDDLKAFAKDQEKPYWIRLIVIDLNDRKVRQRVMSDYRDWLFGKAKQDTDLTVNLSDDFKRALLKASSIDSDVD